MIENMSDHTSAGRRSPQTSQSLPKPDILDQKLSKVVVLRRLCPSSRPGDEVRAVLRNPGGYFQNGTYLTG